MQELTALYDDSRSKLQSSVSEYQSTVQKLQVLEQEVTVLKQNLNAATANSRGAESKIQELTVKITEITNINNQLVQVKQKLEQDLKQVSVDYDDVARELKLADDRANKAGSDAQHFESLLREENVKFQRADQARKALETEVRTMTVKMEEFESTAVQSSRVTIKKMEARIEELEVMYNREKSLHIEVATALHKKERAVKELILQSEEDRKNIIILQESLDKLNEKIKMYKRQLEEQESISNSNIMRVKKFQRELESAEHRAEEAESTLNAFRSRQRVFAAAEHRQQEEQRSSVEREVVVKKVVHNVNVSNVSDSRVAASSSSAAAERYGSSSNYGLTASREARAGSTALGNQLVTQKSLMAKNIIIVIIIYSRHLFDGAALRHRQHFLLQGRVSGLQPRRIHGQVLPRQGHLGREGGLRRQILRKGGEKLHKASHHRLIRAQVSPRLNVGGSVPTPPKGAPSREK